MRMHVVGVLGAVGLGAMHGDARAGKLDLGFGLQATATAWPGDPGGGATIDAAWWFRPWIGASFIGKEQHARVDDRYLTYLSFNAAVRQPLGRLRLTGTLGLVHQHEEPGIVVMSEPLLSAFGVADGIRHRMAGRTGVQLALPFTDHAHGDWYVALDVDGTEFMDNDKGPRWMASAGLSIGFTYDFAAKAASR